MFGMGMYKKARKYGYAATRAKAMESKLIDSATMRSIADAKDVDSILSILFQTDYSAAIAKFGGLGINPIMLDFAVSENMAERVSKLAEITPHEDQHVIRKIIARWDLANIKMVLEAVDRKQPYEAISQYIINSGGIKPVLLRDAAKADNVQEAIQRMMRSKTYRKTLSVALEAYKKTRNVMDASAWIDMQHYRELGELAVKLGRAKDASAVLIMMDIDMRNMITMLRAKKKGLRYNDISKTIMPNGTVTPNSLASVYNSTEDVVSLALKSKAFDMKVPADIYRVNGQLLSFEIGMRNQIFNESSRLLKSAVLTLGALVDYVYMKEIEVFTLRALIKSKEYGLSREDVSRLVAWTL